MKIAELVSRRPKRRWSQYRLWALLFVVTVACGWLSWQAYRAEQEAVAVAGLEGMGGHVTSKARGPQWLSRLLGARLGRRAVRAIVDSDRAEAAVPYLKALPDLEGVVIWRRRPPNGDRWADERATLLVRQSLPNIQVSEAVDFDDPAAMLLPFITPEPWSEELPSSHGGKDKPPPRGPGLGK